MKRTWTIIGVADVGWSFAWYQSLFGLPKTVPGHNYFGQIVDTDGTCCSVFTNGVRTSTPR